MTAQQEGGSTPAGVRDNAPMGGQRGGRRAYGYFFCRDAQMWEDSWTYGDWRQYICERGNTTQCARISRLHVFFPLQLFGLWLMKAVGPLNRGDSGAWRVMPGEEASL